MTEADAKQRWCPMGRLAFFERAPNEPAHAMCAVNTFKIGDEPERRSSCIGSGCMLWRWADIPNPAYVEQMAQFNPMSIPSCIKSDTDGYCGLAGKP